MNIYKQKGTKGTLPSQSFRKNLTISPKNVHEIGMYTMFKLSIGSVRIHEMRFIRLAS